ncbi:barstar family protein [Pseudarthrobacter sp. WHRI 8279]|uniref:barstar family protein n=1 Tax=Pseudarthrobacter sp. WHRI 8279 TaxID=3162566 RepID=UPI0032F04F25
MKNPTDFLEVPTSPSFQVLVSDPGAADTLARGWADNGLLVRIVRGAKMRTTTAAMDEMAAALQFPYYFSENWAALDDCLSDMGWLLPAPAIVLLVRNAGQVLADEDPHQLVILARTLADAINEYAAPVALGEWWDRPAVPFHVVLQADEHGQEALVARWEAAGAQTSVRKP